MQVRTHNSGVPTKDLLDNVENAAIIALKLSDAVCCGNPHIEPEFIELQCGEFRNVGFHLSFSRPVEKEEAVRCKLGMVLYNTRSDR